MGDFTTREEVEKVYRQRASHYDRASSTLDTLGFGYNRLRWEAVEELDLKPGDAVLEIGCGTGANFPLLEERIGANGRLTGVDLTHSMLNEAEKKIKTAGWTNVDLIHCSAKDYEFPARGFDGVLSTFALTLEPEYDAVIAGIASALRPGKRFAIADLKLARGWRLVFLPFLLPIMRPFAVSLKLAPRHPWESMKRHMEELKMTEHLGGYLYVASALAPQLK